MENMLFVLLIIGISLFSLYNNYKKELAKNAKRRPHVRPVSTPGEYQQVNTKEFNAKKVKMKPATAVQPMTEAEINRIPESLRSIDKQVPQNKIDTKIEQSNENSDFQFDLRQAVIQSAILERPFK